MKKSEEIQDLFWRQLTRLSNGLITALDKVEVQGIPSWGRITGKVEQKPYDDMYHPLKLTTMMGNAYHFSHFIKKDETLLKSQG